jgi:hypothetical protein
VVQKLQLVIPITFILNDHALKTGVSLQRQGEWLEILQPPPSLLNSAKGRPTIFVNQRRNLVHQRFDLFCPR